MPKLSVEEAYKLMKEDDELVWAFDEHHQPHTDYSKTIFRKEAHKIAKESNITVGEVKITYCAPVAEYCIYVNGKWSGYLDVDGTDYENYTF